MKYMTMNDVNQLKAIIAEKRIRLDAVMGQLSMIQDRLNACTTHEQIDAVEAEYRELVDEGNELLTYVRKAQAKVNKFYAGPVAA